MYFIFAVDFVQVSFDCIQVTICDNVHDAEIVSYLL